MGDSIKDLKEIEWEEVDWIHLAENKNKCQYLVTAVMNIWVL
jgi:hypothetical protein